MPREEETREGIESEGEKPKGESVYELGQDTKAEEPFEYDAEAPNLVEAFSEHPEGRAALKRLAEKAMTDFDAAWQATDGFRKQMAETWKLFSGTLDPKGPEFKDMSKQPVLTPDKLKTGSVIYPYEKAK